MDSSQNVEKQSSKVNQLLNKGTKKRWERIKDLLIKKTPFKLSEQLYLELFRKKNCENFVEYEIPEISNSNNSSSQEKQSSIKIMHHQSTVTVEEIKQFNSQQVDSTGIALWPAEEALAYFCIKNIEIIKNFRNFIELGAGYSGLTSLVVAKYLLEYNHQANILKLLQQQQSQNQVQQQQQQEEEKQKLEEGDQQQRQQQQQITVLEQNTSSSHQNILNFIITDGNDTCSQQLQKNIEINKGAFSQSENSQYQQVNLVSANLVWSSQLKLPVSENINQKFDCILLADCLFFKDFHDALIHTLQVLMNSTQGLCWIAAPQRGDSMSVFLAKAQLYFDIQEISFEDNYYQSQMIQVRQSASYEQERHEIKFIQLKLKQQQSIDDEKN